MESKQSHLEFQYSSCVCVRNVSIQLVHTCTQLHDSAIDGCTCVCLGMDRRSSHCSQFMAECNLERRFAISIATVISFDQFASKAGFTQSFICPMDFDECELRYPGILTCKCLNIRAWLELPRPILQFRKREGGSFIRRSNWQKYARPECAFISTLHSFILK